MGGSYLKGGWKRKYVIAKANGKPLDPKAKYFVLRYDSDGDPNARAAMRAYAVNVQAVNPKLASDILDRVAREEKKFLCPRCKGSGSANEGRCSKACRACGGTGFRKTTSTRKVAR